MTKQNIAQVSAKLYELLKDLERNERQRVIAATQVLFGDSTNELPTGGADGQGGEKGNQSTVTASAHDPKGFMDEKNPQNKGESLAVAARYRELHQKAETHTKDELKKVFTDSRRNFDSSHFARDMQNARNQSGFFNKNTDKGSDTLSYYGQNYVDALPDREAAKKISKPKTRGATRKKTASNKKK